MLCFTFTGLVEFWSPIPRNFSIISHADLMVGPNHADHVVNYLKCSGMEVEITSNNLQQQIDEENITVDTDTGIETRPGTHICFTHTMYNLLCMFHIP